MRELSHEKRKLSKRWVIHRLLLISSHSWLYHYYTRRNQAGGEDGHTLYGCVDWNQGEYAEAVSNTVTPFMGVWIEMEAQLTEADRVMSHPLWVCGLKSECCNPLHPAWWSHPLWVCGLKLEPSTNTAAGRNESHPLWVCGLKFFCFGQ